jgi:hypothetical protein
MHLQDSPAQQVRDPSRFHHNGINAFVVEVHESMVNLQMSLNSNSNPNSSSSASHEAKHCPIPNLHGHFVWVALDHESNHKTVTNTL